MVVYKVWKEPPPRALDPNAKYIEGRWCSDSPSIQNQMASTRRMALVAILRAGDNMPADLGA